MSKADEIKEKARMYYRKVNGDNSLIPNRINEDDPNFCFTPDDMIHFATDFSAQENKELIYYIKNEIECMEDIKKHSTNKDVAIGEIRAYRKVLNKIEHLNNKP
jgi:hypothetical protein